MNPEVTSAAGTQRTLARGLFLTLALACAAERAAAQWTPWTRWENAIAPYPNIVQGSPQTGHSFVMSLPACPQPCPTGGGQSGRISMLFLGFTGVWPTTPNYSLAAYGLPSCCAPGVHTGHGIVETRNNAIYVGVVYTSGPGGGVFGMSVPADPGLAGLNLWAQVLCADCDDPQFPLCVGRRCADLSGGLQIQIYN